MLAPLTWLCVALACAAEASLVHTEFKPLASTSQAAVTMHGLAPIATALPQHECALYCSYKTQALFQ